MGLQVAVTFCVDVPRADGERATLDLVLCVCECMRVGQLIGTVSDANPINKYVKYARACVYVYAVSYKQCVTSTVIRFTKSTFGIKYTIFSRCGAFFFASSAPSLCCFNIYSTH